MVCVKAPARRDGTSYWPVQVDEPLRFRNNSSLLVLNGLRDERGPAGAHYVRLVGGRFIDLPVRARRPG